MKDIDVDEETAQDFGDSVEVSNKCNCFVCICLCEVLCVCVLARERERKRGIHKLVIQLFWSVTHAAFGGICRSEKYYRFFLSSLAFSWLRLTFSSPFLLPFQK